MSRAVAESFFSTLEFEGPDTSTWRYVSDGEPGLFRFIEGYYNQKRIHSHNNYVAHAAPCGGVRLQAAVVRQCLSEERR